jgi:membrane protease YdiL (CAAX protease family)
MNAPFRESTKAWPRALLPLGVGIGTTLVVTGLSYALPRDHQATGIGLTFLAVTYALVLRHDGDSAERHGLALGGLFDPAPLSSRRLLREGAMAIAWALGLALLIFPPFWFGWLAFWQPEAGFAPREPLALLSKLPGELLVIALPEEAFYRGYLQSALDDAFPKRIRLLGAPVGASLLVTSALFAVGHLLTELDPNRLAVFFPALLFGWLRAKTGGIGAGMLFHALSNMFTLFLAQSYGLTS